MIRPGPSDPVTGKTLFEYALLNPTGVSDAGDRSHFRTEVSDPETQWFAQVAYLYRDNQRLLGELAELARRLHAARSYLVRPNGNTVLGRAYYRYWKSKHSAVLTRLRANRVKARRVLQEIAEGARASETLAIRLEDRMPRAACRSLHDLRSLPAYDGQASSTACAGRESTASMVTTR